MPTPNSLAIEILQELEKRTDDAGFVSRVEKRVNYALDEIAVATNYNMFKTRSTFNTVAGTAVYTLPVGGREISQLRYTDTGEPIWLWTTQEAARRMAKLEDDGRAGVWIEDGVVTGGTDVLYQFRLAPVPDSVLEIEREFFYHPSVIASATVIPVQNQYIPLVRRFVKASLYELSQQENKAEIERREYKALLDGLVKQEKRKVAASTRLQNCDIQRDGGRPQAQLDPSIFPSSWL